METHLLNLYSAIAVSPDRHPAVNHDAAAQLIDFLASDGVQDIIGKLGVCDYGAPLLVPARDWNPAGGAHWNTTSSDRQTDDCPQE